MVIGSVCVRVWLVVSLRFWTICCTVCVCVCTCVSVGVCLRVCVCVYRYRRVFAFRCGVGECVSVKENPESLFS